MRKRTTESKGGRNRFYAHKREPFLSGLCSKAFAVPSWHAPTTLLLYSKSSFPPYLSSRYMQDKIYTAVGDILLALNPFKPVPLYSDGQKQSYQPNKDAALMPHIYGIVRVPTT